MSKNFFITGTDTDAGKTLVAEALMLKAKTCGLRSMGLKPIAAGAEEIDGQLVNRDAYLLQKAATVPMPYAQVNPVLLEEAIAPHIAAAHEQRRVTANAVTGYIRGALMQPADFRVIEGAGGWLVPLNDRESFSAIPKALSLPVIMVVGMKLGCLNHALLTARAIYQDGLQIAGWFATQIDPDMACVEENLETLQRMLPGEFLGFMPFQENITVEQVADVIQLPESVTKP